MIDAVFGFTPNSTAGFVWVKRSCSAISRLAIRKAPMAKSDRKKSMIMTLRGKGSNVSGKKR